METSPDARTRTVGLLPLLAVTYCASTAVVMWGVVLGEQFLRVASEGEAPPIDTSVDPLAVWDGIWYRRITDSGYSYDPNTESSIAFFPGYPLVTRCTKALIPMPTVTALVLVSHASLIGVFFLIALYGVHEPATYASVAVAFGLWPMTLFFRMAYSESLFVLLELLVLLAIARRWPLLVVSMIAGAATGVRAVGVALFLPLLWDCWRRSENRVRFVARAAAYGPLACWGLLAYMAYLQIEFGDALAFVKTQQHWAHRPDLRFPDRIWSLATLEPLWSVYVPSSEAYWARFEPVTNPLFSLQFWNPIYFVTCVGLVAFGAYKRWLTTPEILLAAGLLLIPYVTHSYRAVCMAQARYAASVFPAYIVMGRLAERMPPYVLALVASLLAVKLAFFSALFAAWYRII